MAGRNGRLGVQGNLVRLHRAKNELAEEWQRQTAQGEAREEALRAQPADIKHEFKKFYKRLPISKWDLLSGNYELHPLTRSRKGRDFSVFRSIGIGLGIGVAVLIIALTIILMVSQ